MPRKGQKKGSDGKFYFPAESVRSASNKSANNNSSKQSTLKNENQNNNSNLNRAKPAKRRRVTKQQRQARAPTAQQSQNLILRKSAKAPNAKSQKAPKKRTKRNKRKKRGRRHADSDSEYEMSELSELSESEMENLPIASPIVLQTRLQMKNQLKRAKEEEDAKLLEKNPFVRKPTCLVILSFLDTLDVSKNKVLVNKFVLNQVKSSKKFMMQLAQNETEMTDQCLKQLLHSSPWQRQLSQAVANHNTDKIAKYMWQFVQLCQKNNWCNSDKCNIFVQSGRNGRLNEAQIGISNPPGESGRPRVHASYWDRRYECSSKPSLLVLMHFFVGGKFEIVKHLFGMLIEKYNKKLDNIAVLVCGCKKNVDYCFYGHPSTNPMKWIWDKLFDAQLVTDDNFVTLCEFSTRVTKYFVEEGQVTQYRQVFWGTFKKNYDYLKGMMNRSTLQGGDGSGTMKRWTDILKIDLSTISSNCYRQEKAIVEQTIAKDLEHQQAQELHHRTKAMEYEKEKESLMLLQSIWKA